LNAPHWLPRVTRLRGTRIERHFWLPGGGYDRNIETSTALLRMIDYIHMNPVRRGLIETPSEWKWSSAAWYLNGTPTPFEIDRVPAEWLDDAN